MRIGAGKESGFTLVEVIVAMAIFSMVIAGGLVGISRGYELIGNSRDYTRISQILQSEVETLRTLSWADFKLLAADEIISINSQFDIAAYDAYTVRREIVAESATLKRVQISVSYTSKQGKTVTLKHLTYFTSGGLNDYFYRTI